MAARQFVNPNHMKQNLTSCGTVTEEIRELEEYLVSSNYAVALSNNLPLAKSIVGQLCKRLELNLIIKRVDRYTDLRTFVGDPRIPVSYELSEFHNMAKKGGMLLIEVLEVTGSVIENLQLLEPLLPHGRAKWKIPDYSNFGHIEVHPDFHVLLSLPMLKPGQFLPPSLTSRIRTVELPPKYDETSASSTHSTELGPHNVLVLMKFGVTEYDKWYQEKLRPVVDRLGKCIRMDAALEDWQSEVTRGINRADAVIVDLSHDLVDDFSKNVLWELNRLWQAFRSEHPDGVLRKKMIFISRGLESINSRHPDSQFVYSSEIDREMIFDMPTSASNLEDLLGFEIRRYDPTDTKECTIFLKCLEKRLMPLVQNIPAPLSDSELSRQIEELKGSSSGISESEWLDAISERDFDACLKLSHSDEVPMRIVHLLGDLISTVSVSQVVSIPGYWSLAKIALKNSPRLRSHYRKLLATSQLSLNDPYVSNFCENVWIAFTGIDELLPQNEKEQLAELANKEGRMVIREVSDYFRYAHLPKEQQDDALAKLLMEHMIRDDKKP